MSAPTELLQWCVDRLALHEAAAARDPLANSVRVLAVDLWDRIAAGELRHDEIVAMVRHIADEASRHRASRLAAKTMAADWAELVEEAFAGLAGRPFEEASATLTQVKAGVVFTAHPTFALSRRMRARIGALASGAKADTAPLPHQPDASITLKDEHDDVVRAIDLASASYRKLLSAVFDWLIRHYPSDWKEARPFPISIASWVGYDLDGRTDISWPQSLAIRLSEKAMRLSSYAQALGGISPANALVEKLETAAQEARTQADLFASNLDEPADIVAAANRLTSQASDRLVSLDEVKASLQGLIDAAPTEAARKMAIIRSEMDAFGLGYARIHLRVNAAQVRSALRDDLGLSLEQDFIDRTTLDAAAAIAASTARQRVNFGLVHLEKMTARRQLMLCAQILKHVDADTPIRFLIAEVESPATIMGAIYLARLYGVDHRVDISPLFETPNAIESGGRFMERLLEEEEFVRYVRMRGRISIQCGFSDSGRFMGQVAADLAIERLHILVSRALAAKSIRNVEVVIFNTHGESMGRGGHTGTLAERWDYLMTPWARARLAHDGLALNAEFSFQGGDGFLHFENSILAEATLQALFRWSQHAPARNASDRFYTDINFSWDLYRTIKGWQERLFDNPSYQAVLGAFSYNLLPVTGSRKVRRQSGASQSDAARSLRAIPHNAILQQLAVPSNTLGGFGAAAAREPERFARMMRESPRMRSVFALVSRARSLFSLSTLRSYANLLDPSFWTVRSSRALGEAPRPAYLRVADRLTALELDVAIDRLANALSVDRQNFDEVCRHTGRIDCEAGQFPARLYVLHACRMAMIADGLTLAASTPPFSPRHEATRDSIIDMAIGLRFAEVAALIDEIFPESDDAPAEFAMLSEHSEPAKGPGGYPGIQRNFVEPLGKLDQQIKEVAVAISHFYDAIG